MLAYSKYKNSRIPWIGKIPAHWQISTIKRTAHIKGRIGWQGLTSEEYRNDGEYLLITGTDFLDGKIQWHQCWHVSAERYREDENIQLKEHDVLVTKDGTIGKVAFVENMPKSTTLNSGVFVTRPFLNSYVPKFMFWALNSDIFPEFIEYSKVGTTIAHLYQKTFEKFTFPLPSLHEQKVIAAYLDKTCAAIDKAIEAKQKQLEILDALRKSIIHKAVTRGLDDSVELKDSGVEWLGKIPKHWKFRQIKRDFQITLGKMLQSNQKEDKETEENYLRSANIKWDNANLSDVRKMWFSPNDKERLKLEYGDLLVSEGGDVGRTSIWKNELSDCFIQNAINRVRARKKDRTTFLYYWLFFIKHIGYIDAIVSRITIAHLTAEKLEKIYYVRPPVAEQSNIVTFLDKKTDEISKIEGVITSQISTLNQYRKSLIHECVTGKRRVNEDHAREQ